jgi:hypothetical protein
VGTNAHPTVPARLLTLVGPRQRLGWFAVATHTQSWQKQANHHGRCSGRFAPLAGPNEPPGSPAMILVAAGSSRLSGATRSGISSAPGTVDRSNRGRVSLEAQGSRARNGGGRKAFATVPRRTPRCDQASVKAPTLRREGGRARRLRGAGLGGARVQAAEEWDARCFSGECRGQGWYGEARGRRLGPCLHFVRYHVCRGVSVRPQRARDAATMAVEGGSWHDGAPMQAAEALGAATWSRSRRRTVQCEVNCATVLRWTPVSKGPGREWARQQTAAAGEQSGVEGDEE